MRPDDGERLREICVNLTLSLHTDFCKLMEMPVFELIKTVKVTLKAVKKNGKRNSK